MPFPFLKLGALIIRTLSKPAANRISYEAGRHEKLSKLCVAIGQINHNISQRIAVLSAGYKYLGTKPLVEDIAKKNGVSILAEVIVFSVAGSIMIYEYHKSVRKEEQKIEKETEKRSKILASRDARLTTIERKLNRIVDDDLKLQELERQFRNL